MGRGPNEAIFLKLIKRYLRFNVDKRSFPNFQNALSELELCWTKRGVNHPDCNYLVDNFDEAVQKESDFYRHFIKGMGKYGKEFDSVLNNRKPKCDMKGDHQKPKFYFDPPGEKKIKLQTVELNNPYDKI